MKTENTIRVSKSINEILGGKLTHIITLKKTTHQNSYNNRTEKKLSGKDKLYLFFSRFFFCLLVFIIPDHFIVTR